MPSKCLPRTALDFGLTRGLAIGFNVETVTYKNIKLQVWDLGGQTFIRPYWKCYYANTDAIIYVIDSNDRERIGIAAEELQAMLKVEDSLCPSFGFSHLI